MWERAPRHPEFTAALPAPLTLPSMAEEAGVRRLSLRETRVARLVAEGRADEQIADILGITVIEVSAELAEAIRKLGLRSRTELALLVPEPRTRKPERDAADEGGGHGGSPTRARQEGS